MKSRTSHLHRPLLRINIDQKIGCRVMPLHPRPNLKLAMPGHLRLDNPFQATCRRLSRKSARLPRSSLGFGDNHRTPHLFRRKFRHQGQDDSVDKNPGSRNNTSMVNSQLSESRNNPRHNWRDQQPQRNLTIMHRKTFIYKIGRSS
jgi:hypothetical protein